MDITSNTTIAPLTRREAREIERRTGVRPLAGAPAVDQRHDTGEIARNEMAALLSVIPSDLADVVRTGTVSTVSTEGDAASDAEPRSLSVRAAVPAQVIAQRRTRTAGGFAAAASAAAVATFGVSSVIGGAAPTQAHQADLLAAVSAAPQTKTDTTDLAHDPSSSEAPAPAVTADGGTSVVEFTPESVLAAGEAVQQPEPVVEAPVVSEPVSDPVVEAPATEAPAPTMGAVTAVASTTMHAPIAAGATITDGFGPRVAPIAGASTNHRGIDLVTGATCGTEIYAVMSGTVVAAGWNGTYGNTIDITAADGTMFRFAHLDSMNVGVGATVSGGDVIGLGGSTGASTGCNLHFEVFENGANVDPQAWLTDRGLF